MDELAPTIQGAWLIIGDFNLIRYSHEKNSNNFDRALSATFNAMIQSLAWFELPLLDRRFTWTNGQENPVLARLDRAFFNNDWDLVFPDSALTSLPRPTSDHHPLMIMASTTIPNPSHFRFENSWLLDPTFLPTTLARWSSGLPARDAALDLAASVKRFRSAAKVWKRDHRFIPHLENNCHFIIALFDFQEESRRLAAGEIELREEARKNLELSVCRSAAHWKQRGKFRAIQEGDENTRFFHARASQRHRRNQIRALDVDGELLVDHGAKAGALRSFYSNLLGRARPARWGFDLAQLYHGARRVDGPALVLPFEPKEVKAAVDGMDRGSAPGPDGLGPSFYRAAWGTVQPAMLRLFDAVHARRADLGAINRAHVVLLPKADGVLAPGSYRPVSLQNCSVKTVCKALTSRLQAQIGNLVDENQSGFLSGRSISENFVFATELVQCCHKRRSPSLILKLDFSKAFDSIN
jgi:hypothetical protein